MTPTTEDLRSTLQAMADEHPAPAPAELLAELRARRAGRRRNRVALGAAAAATAVVAGAVGMQLLEGPDLPTLPADGTGSAADRGWVLDGAEPPEQADGLVRLETVRVPYAGPDDLSLPDAGDAGTSATQRFAVLWCEVGPDDAAITTPSLRLQTPDGGAVEVPCLPEDGDPSEVTVTPVPLPPGEGVTVEPTWQGDVPSGGEAVLGVYREAASAEYDFPGWPDPPLPPPTHGPDAVVIDPDSAGGYVDGFLHGGTRAATVTLTSDSSLELWRGVPGGLEVDVDGVRVTDDGDAGAGDAWRDADPELRDGVWTAFTAGQRRSLALPEEVLPEPGATRTVTVTVVPRAGAEHWQVAVLGTAQTPSPVPPSDPGADAGVRLPEWYAGHRLVTTWQVPRTGAATELVVPGELAQEGASVAWALWCPSVAVGDDGALTTARVVVDGTAVERVCTSGGAEALHTVADAITRTDLPAVGPSSTVRVAAPFDAEGGSALVAAYVPVPFEEFDFAAAEAPLGWDPIAAVRGEVEIDQALDAADLTDGTVTELTLSPGTVGVRLTTEGVGRVRLLVDGSPADGWSVDQDGWWTSWTDDRFTEVPVAWVQAPSRGGELTLEVDGYSDGAVEVEVLVVRE